MIVQCVYLLLLHREMLKFWMNIQVAHNLFMKQQSDKRIELAEDKKNGTVSSDKKYPGLAKHVETRWGSHVTSMKSIADNADVFQACVVHRSWKEQVINTPDKEFVARAEDVKSTVCVDKYFDEKKHICDLFSCIADTIDKQQSDAPNLSLCWSSHESNKEHLKAGLAKNFKGMKSRVKKTLSQKEFDGPEQSIEALVMKYFEDRFDYLFEDTMLAAFFLDPRNHLPAKPSVPSGSIAKILKFLKELLPEEEHEALTKEFRLFRMYEDPLHCTDLVWTEDECKNPRMWWTMYGGHVPHLQKVAQILLSLPGSSAAVERSFSMLDFVHSALRNRLDKECREKLLYIYFNVRALHRERVLVLGTEKFYETKGGKLKVVIPQDEGVKDYSISQCLLGFG